MDNLDTKFQVIMSKDVGEMAGRQVRLILQKYAELWQLIIQPLVYNQSYEYMFDWDAHGQHAHQISSHYV